MRTSTRFDRGGRWWVSCVAAAIWLSLPGPQPVMAAGGAVSGGQSGEPGWSPVIVATGSYRAMLGSLPIERRPYRPLHVYGNTVRRMHHRGTPLPWRGRWEGATGRRLGFDRLGRLRP